MQRGGSRVEGLGLRRNGNEAASQAGWAICMTIQSLEDNFSSLLTCRCERESNRMLMGAVQKTTARCVQVKQERFTSL